MLDGDSAIKELLELRFELGEFGRLIPIEPAKERCGHVAFYNGNVSESEIHERKKIPTLRGMNKGGNSRPFCRCRRRSPPSRPQSSDRNANHSSSPFVTSPGGAGAPSFHGHIRHFLTRKKHEKVKVSEIGHTAEILPNDKSRRTYLRRALYKSSACDPSRYRECLSMNGNHDDHENKITSNSQANEFFSPQVVARRGRPIYPLPAFPSSSKICTSSN